ncbi:MAG: TonB family protein, partial [Polyangiaceae bacterium]|nr:TonB family protein [Polyangiaceae bacterium]
TFAVGLVLELDVVGTVKTAVVERTSGRPDFDEAALEAGKKLQFEPALRNGKPVAAKIRHRYEFKALPTRLRGRVVLEGTKPIAGTQLRVSALDAAGGEAKALLLDENGAFDSSELPPGKTKLSVSVEGFESFESTEEIANGEVVELTIRLRKKETAKAAATDEDEVDLVVRGVRPQREVTRRTIDQREILKIPGSGGDALRALQNLPGLARPPGLLGILLVRGQSPQDSNIFVDGTLVPLVYHFGGLSSVIPTEMIERIDFFPGNFSAQYGRVMGGIIDVALKEPEREKLHGVAQVDLIDARVFAKGPLGKGWTFAVGGRRSWVDAWLGPVLEALGAGVTTAPRYFDYQLMVQKDFSKKTSLRFTLFGSDDKLEILLKNPSSTDPALSGGISAATRFWRIQSKLKHKFSDSTELSMVSAIGEDQIDFSLGDVFFRLSTIPVTSRLEISHKVEPGLIVRTGWDIFYTPYDVTARFPQQPQPGEPPGGPFISRQPLYQTEQSSLYRPAVYTEFEISKWKGGKLLPGLRLDYSKETKEWDVSPRLAIRQAIQSEYPKFLLKGGVGVFRQPPQPQETSAVFGQTGLVSNRAIHTSIGFEKDITEDIELSMEGFYKDLNYLIVPRARNAGEGYVVGLETLLRYKSSPNGRFFGWLAYTLSRSARTDLPGYEERLAPFDQTHILTILGSYKLGKGWEIGARFRLVSGNLFTPNTYGFFDQNSGVYLPQSTFPINSERLPMFHQLDIRVDKTWQWGDFKLNAYLDLINSYNSQNPEGVTYNYNFTSRTFATGLPILPSLGIRGEL